MKTATYKFDSILLGHTGGYIFQSVTDRRLTAVYHTHDFYELIWMRRGWGRQTVNGQDVHLSEGEAMLLRPGEAHCFTDQAEDILVLSLSVKHAELEVVAGAFSPLLPARLARAPGPIRLTLGTPLGEVSGENEYDCKYLLAFFLRAYMTATPAEGAALPPQIASLAVSMKEPENLRGGIAAALACTHYSQCHLSRLVRTHFGMGLKEWINEMRLEEAYRRLILSDLGVLTIAADVGFASPAHFCRIFKARYGMSPAALRKSRGVRTV